jgi:hypothetical protein
MARKINYYARNFADVRTELINFVRQYYPDILNDFNDASVGMMLIELNAAVSDMLSFHTDRMFQETQLDYAQERKSILAKARTFGLKVPGKRPSITIVDFTVIVPVLGDSFNLAYAPIIRRGIQVSGGGRVFETVDDIDFSSPFTTGGLPNRLVIPNVDSNGNIINYTLTKREIVLNGTTKIFKRVLTEADVRPFFELVLPDNDVLSIESIITLEGTNYVNTPTVDEFYNFDNRWFEMDALAEDKVFIEDTISTAGSEEGIKNGKWVRVDRKFIREYTDRGFTRLIFGGGSQDVSSLCEFDTNPALINRIGDFINNNSLGITPSANKTMFVRYRVGGGANTNVGANTITNVVSATIFVNGPDTAINTAVSKSLKVNNPVPALGGKDEPSVEEIRNLVRYNFSAQNRAVTIKDYQSRIALMPGEFGVPFRCGVYEYQNKISVSILTLDSNGKLSPTATNVLKQNIANYLSDYRMLNDYVEINNGRVINLGFEIDLFIDKQFPQSQIISEVIKKVDDYMDINKHEMGENIMLSQLLEIINNVGGVLNVIDIRVYNKVGQGKYSMNEIAQPYIDEATRQIDLLGQFTLFGEPTGMFEVRYPESDILVRVK